MDKLQFSKDWEDWRGKVENWGKEHSVMIKRYDLIRDYESLMTRMGKLPRDEWEQFCHRMTFEGAYWLGAARETPDAYIFENDNPRGEC